MKPFALVMAALAARSAALTLDPDNKDSIKAAASTIARGMMSYYNGNQPGNVPGLLPQPYYWWEAGAMFGALIDYWYYTNDTTYNAVTTQAMQFQVGPEKDYMPPNQTKSEGNDDQGFWGLAAMSAAEARFPDPPAGSPQWLALAQAVFNLQASRWDNSTCGGGLRWQIFAFNTGYNYKNSISNGCFFNLAARLGQYTGNKTYYEWADRMWDWVTAVQLVSPTYQVFDGTDDTINCTRLNHVQWTYNSGVYLMGAAVMWKNSEGADKAKWEAAVRGLITSASVFFQNDIMYEVACEPRGNCDTDQQSFKAYLSRWMAATTKLAPFTADLILPKIRASAVAAAKSCSGGSDGVTCGTKWTTGAWDNTWGVGQQMNALEVIQSLLIGQVKGPVTQNTGGTSKGNPNAGAGGDASPGNPTRAIGMSDRAGAGILTAVIMIGMIGGAWWMIA